MAFWGKSRKEDLFRLGSELGASVKPEMKIIDIKKAVLSCPEYDEELAKDLLVTFASERKEELEFKRLQLERKEEQEFEFKKLQLESEERRKKEELDFELRKLQLERDTPNENVSYVSTNNVQRKPKIDLHTIIQKFDPSQRFETLSVDLFGPLPVSHGKKWIYIVEDVTTKWVELFALENATAKECATTLVEEVFMRYGIPRRIISDNGPQFVSAVMQQLCYLLDIHQSLIPVYHPQANPVERKNRDLKPRLAILVNNRHDSWSEKLPAIRFALNTSKCSSTGKTAAFLSFGRELRTVDDVTNDFRSIIDNDNFVVEMTPYLKKLGRFTSEAKEVMQEQQDKRKSFADQRRRPAPTYTSGDLVLVAKPHISNKNAGITSKFMPRRDGPFIIVAQKSPVSYSVANTDSPNLPVGVYHTSALTPFRGNKTPPIRPLRRRGRPTKRQTLDSPPAAIAQKPRDTEKSSADPWSGRLRGQRGRL